MRGTGSECEAVGACPFFRGAETGTGTCSFGTRASPLSDRERRDGAPELVIRGEHPVIPMPVLPRRRPRQGLAPFVSANGACPFCPPFGLKGSGTFSREKTSQTPRRGQIGLGEKAGPAGTPAGRHSLLRSAAGTKTPSVTRVPEVDMMVERRTEAVQKGDAAEPRAGGCGGGGVARAACRSAEQSLDLVKKDLREGGDGRGSVGQKAPQPLRHGDHPLPHRYRRDAAGPQCGRRRPCRKPCDRGDHGRTGRWTAGVNSRTLSAGQSGSPSADRKARRPSKPSGGHLEHLQRLLCKAALRAGTAPLEPPPVSPAHGPPTDWGELVQVWPPPAGGGW